MPIPSWNEDPDAWDRIDINGFIFHDTSVDVDGDFGNDFDVKKAPGADGATLTNKGVEPIKPSVRWVIYNEVHWLIYQALIAKVYPKPGKTPLPLLEVIHPQLQLLSKLQFRLVRVHTLKKVGPQQLEARFDLLEYFKAPKPVPKPQVTPATKWERERRVDYDPNFFRKPSAEVKPGEGSNIAPPKPE